MPSERRAQTTEAIRIIGRDWMLDITTWPGDVDSFVFVDAMVWLLGRMPAEPEHFYRSYTTAELDRIVTARSRSSTGVRAREMNLYRRYFDLVAAGRKTIEVRAQYPNLRSLKAGDHIRFVCGRDDALTRVKRVSRYGSFEEMLDAEGPANVNPDSPREQQPANIRRIYGPEKEALGVPATPARARPVARSYRIDARHAIDIEVPPPTPSPGLSS